MPPNVGQLILLIAAIILFFVGGCISLARLRQDAPGLRLGAKICLYFGVLCSLAVLIWHSISRGSWLPIGDNFDALIWLAMLLALIVLYTQRVHPVPGLDWFIMPIVIILLLGAGHFGAAEYRAYGHNAWNYVHSATAYGGAVAFAFAAASGAMYLATARRLRSKQIPTFSLGSLERSEHITMISVTLGFALLTVGVVTGVVRWLEGIPPTRPKVLLSVAAWLVYAVVLHAPINPRFRGRRAAILSLVGFILMIATLIAVQFMPGGIH